MTSEDITMLSSYIKNNFVITGKFPVLLTAPVNCNILEERLLEKIKRNQILSETLDDIFVISDQLMVSLSGVGVDLVPLQDENAHLLYF
jgi:hypothetical protein